MEKAYWLSRQREALRSAKTAGNSEARLIHYDLAGRYSVKANSAEARGVNPDSALPLSMNDVSSDGAGPR